MPSFNKIIAVGYLGRDPELRYTPTGTAALSFSVATTERRKDKSGEYQDLTTWFNVTFWGNRAEAVAPHLAKGRFVYVEGRLSQREYQDRDGNTRHSLDINATDLQILVREEKAAGATSGGGTADTRPISDDEIPF